MNLADLFEGPELVNDTSFGLENAHTNHIVATEIVNREDKKLLKKLTSIAHLYDLGNQIALVDVTPGREQVFYIVEFKIELIQLIKSNAITQVAVWRNRARPETQNLAKDIFFSILLPKTKAIMTDSKQTWQGQGFWENRLIDAFKMGLNVYFVQFNQPSMVTKVPSAQTLDDFIRKYNPWGAGPEFRGRKFLITNKTFKEFTS